MLRVNISNRKAAQNQLIVHKIEYENFSFYPFSLDNYQPDGKYLVLSTVIKLDRFQISKQQEYLNIRSFAIQCNDNFVINFRMNRMSAFPNGTLKWEVQHNMS